MEITIRRAKESDAEGVARVHSQGWQETYEGMIDPSYPDSRTFERSLGVFKKSGCRDMFVAECDGEIGGFCGFGPDREDGRHGEIYGIYVLKKYQGFSAGKRLLAAAEAELIVMGFKSLSLWVLEGNERAEGFYISQGFAESGRQKTEILGGEVTEKEYVHHP